MQSKVNTTVTLTLTLSREEADWLKNQMQNPLHGQSTKEENSKDREMRTNFWNALTHPRHTT